MEGDKKNVVQYFIIILGPYIILLNCNDLSSNSNSNIGVITIMRTHRAIE